MKAFYSAKLLQNKQMCKKKDIFSETTALKIATPKKSVNIKKKHAKKERINLIN